MLEVRKPCKKKKKKALADILCKHFVVWVRESRQGGLANKRGRSGEHVFMLQGLRVEA